MPEMGEGAVWSYMIGRSETNISTMADCTKESRYRGQVVNWPTRLGDILDPRRHSTNGVSV